LKTFAAKKVNQKEREKNNIFYGTAKRQKEAAMKG